MIRPLALGLVLLAWPAAAEPYDVPWFQRNHQARADALQRCADNARFSRSDTCANARAAAARSLGSPYPSEPTQFERELPLYMRQYLDRNRGERPALAPPPAVRRG